MSPAPSRASARSQPTRLPPEVARDGGRPPVGRGDPGRVLQAGNDELGRYRDRRRRARPGPPGQPGHPADARGTDPHRHADRERARSSVYNWDAYMYKPVLKAFEDEFGVTVEWTTFQNMEEGIQKLVAGQVQADVFFPTTDYVSRLVEGDLLQPLNHELIPNLEANILEGLLRSRAVLRPRLAVHRAVHDLHDRRGVPAGPDRRRTRRRPPGTTCSSIPRSRTR